MNYRPELPAIAPHMAELPIDERGYPIPAFVAYVDRKPDFRVADERFRETCLKKQVCYVCGQPFTTRHRWFVLGPMCVINRTTSEPPVHRDCAIYSAKGCPFLSRPHMTRRSVGLPEGATSSEHGIMRNPGATALYETRTYQTHRVKPSAGNYLLFLGEPEQVEWYAQGRTATRVEVLQSIVSGYPALIESAVRDGFAGLAGLFEYTERAFPVLPRRNQENGPEGDSLIMQLGEMVNAAVQQLPAKSTKI